MNLKNTINLEKRIVNLPSSESYVKKEIKLVFFVMTMGFNTLRLILKKKNYKIQFVCTRYLGGVKKKIKTFCKKEKIDQFSFKNINSSIAIKKIKSYDLDILASMSYDQIFKKKTIDSIKLQIINCHAGNLPFIEEDLH